MNKFANCCFGAPHRNNRNGEALCRRPRDLPCLCGAAKSNTTPTGRRHSEPAFQIRVPGNLPPGAYSAQVVSEDYSGLELRALSACPWDSWKPGRDCA